jgi:hypothetical protein
VGLLALVCWVTPRLALAAAITVWAVALVLDGPGAGRGGAALPPRGPRYDRCPSSPGRFASALTRAELIGSLP